jgi:hypothetical protein
MSLFSLLSHPSSTSPSLSVHFYSVLPDTLRRASALSVIGPVSDWINAKNQTNVFQDDTTKRRIEPTTTSMERPKTYRASSAVGGRVEAEFPAVALAAAREIRVLDFKESDRRANPLDSAECAPIRAERSPSLTLERSRTQSGGPTLSPRVDAPSGMASGISLKSRAVRGEIAGAAKRLPSIRKKVKLIPP